MYKVIVKEGKEKKVYLVDTTEASVAESRVASELDASLEIKFSEIKEVSYDEIIEAEGSNFFEVKAEQDTPEGKTISEKVLLQGDTFLNTALSYEETNVVEITKGNKTEIIAILRIEE